MDVEVGESRRIWHVGNVLSVDQGLIVRSQVAEVRILAVIYQLSNIDELHSISMPQFYLQICEESISGTL